MKYLFVLILSAITLSLPAQLHDRQVMDAKSGRIINDTNYVYRLPWKNGKSHLLIQTANSQMSHKNELSPDFKMKRGTQMYAALEGTVTFALPAFTSGHYTIKQ